MVERRARLGGRGVGLRTVPGSPEGARPPVVTLLAANGRVLGAIYVAGALVGAVALGLPHGAHFDAVADMVLASVAAVVGLGAWHRRRLGPFATTVLIGFGTLAVSAGVYSGRGDDVSMSAAVIYVWLALAAGLFCSPRGTFAHVAAIAVAYGAVLALSGNQGAPAEWLFVTGTAAVTAAATRYIVADLVGLSEHDPLTGLPNRAGLRRVLERELARCRRGQGPLSLAMVDLDGFKSLNDQHGHLAGDETLVHTVATWQGALRASDVLARFGGDEFVVVLPDTGALEASRVLRRMGRLDGAWECSAGLACWDGNETVDQFLARADTALYGAKDKGGSRRVVLARGGGARPRSEHVGTAAAS